MAIGKEEIRHIAKLSRLSFSESEEEKFIKSFNDILNHVQKINSINTEGVEPCSNVFELKNVMREDKAEKSFDPEILLRNAPEKEETAYLVPRVVE
jgi:aspartyl-tRNA(Asn)/glutamyl-tRNA(Gln) amidotransferase subunit C